MPSKIFIPWMTLTSDVTTVIIKHHGTAGVDEAAVVPQAAAGADQAPVSLYKRVAETGDQRFEHAHQSW